MIYTTRYDFFFDFLVFFVFFFFGPDEALATFAFFFLAVVVDFFLAAFFFEVAIALILAPAEERAFFARPLETSSRIAVTARLIGFLPLAEDSPTIAPTAPPASAPIGPATTPPMTAPVIPPAVCFETGTAALPAELFCLREVAFFFLAISIPFVEK